MADPFHSINFATLHFAWREDGVHVRVATWLDEDQLHADQIPLHEKGKPGDRLGDGWLQPKPLRKIVETEPGILNVFSWQSAADKSEVKP